MAASSSTPVVPAETYIPLLEAPSDMWAARNLELLQAELEGLAKGSAAPAATKHSILKLARKVGVSSDIAATWDSDPEAGREIIAQIRVLLRDYDKVRGSSTPGWRDVISTADWFQRAEHEGHIQLDQIPRDQVWQLESIFKLELTNSPRMLLQNYRASARPKEYVARAGTLVERDQLYNSSDLTQREYMDLVYYTATIGSPHGYITLADQIRYTSKTTEGFAPKPEAKGMRGLERPQGAKKTQHPAGELFRFICGGLAFGGHRDLLEELLATTLASGKTLTPRKRILKANFDKSLNFSVHKYLLKRAAKGGKLGILIDYLTPDLRRIPELLIEMARAASAGGQLHVVAFLEKVYDQTTRALGRLGAGDRSSFFAQTFSAVCRGSSFPILQSYLEEYRQLKLDIVDENEPYLFGILVETLAKAAETDKFQATVSGPNREIVLALLKEIDWDYEVGHGAVLLGSFELLAKHAPYILLVVLGYLASAYEDRELIQELADNKPEEIVAARPSWEGLEDKLEAINEIFQS